MVLAVAFDLRGEATEPHPFAAADLGAGAAIRPRDVDWREIRSGLLPTPALDGAFTTRDIEQGEPIVPSALSITRPIPEGWWAIEMRLPAGAEAGSPARVVVDNPQFATSAVIVSVADGGAFDASTTGLVAVPAEHADEVARAVTRGDAVLLVEP